MEIDYCGCYHPIASHLIDGHWYYKNYKLGFYLIKYDCKLDIWRNSSDLILQIWQNKSKEISTKDWVEKIDPGIILLEKYQIEYATETISCYPYICKQAKDELIEAFERVEKLSILK